MRLREFTSSWNKETIYVSKLSGDERLNGVFMEINVDESYKQYTQNLVKSHYSVGSRLLSVNVFEKNFECLWLHRMVRKF